ncbi:hypothetical protein Tco_1354057 [Tanacetum coccineum]
MEKFKTPSDSPLVTVIDPDDQPMWSSTRTVAPTPSSTIIQLPIHNFHIKAFKILEDNVLLKFDFSDDSQKNPKPKTVVSAGGSNINLDHIILVEKYKALATKINSEFLNIRKELKEMRDGHRDNHTSQNYISDDTSVCNLMEANYIQRYHEGYHDQNSRHSYSYLNHNLNRNSPNSRHRMPHPSQYFELPKTSTEEMMKAWMNKQTEANERMKNQDCTVHIPHMNAKTFADDVLTNHVGDKELNSIDGVRNGVLTKTKTKKNDKGMSKEPNKEWKLNEKAVPHNKNDYHYLWHPTEIPHLNRIIKES